jgi:hypothetical protein
MLVSLMYRHSPVDTVRTVVVEPGSAEGRWIPPGQPATVGDHAIPGGLIYVGRHLRADAGGVEPALINPALPVAPTPGWRVSSGPRLAYHLLAPAARAAYLEWLAGGRIGEAPAGLLLLFCFGLERRVLVDADHDPAVRRELPVIAEEARRLKVLYGDAEFDRLLELLALLTAPRAAPDAVVDGGSMVRVGLARFAAAAAPVPADWALAWVRHHPALTPRSAQVHCPDEFDRLLALRYRRRHGEGWVPPDDVPGVRLRYQPANPGLPATLVCREDLPDVLAEPRATRMLGALVDEVAASLDPYRRWVARYPQGRGSLAAATQLPREMLDPDRGQLGALRAWADSRLDGRPWAVVDAAEFAGFWQTATPARMARDEATALLAVLALLGVGVEPDVRFGAPALASGPAVLFRLGRHPTDRPGARFPAAAATARCAAAVASAARPIDPRGPVGAAVLATIRDLGALLRLDPDENLRLVARTSWLLITGIDVERLGRQTAALDPADRELAGHHLVTVATAADPTVGPATVAMLTRVYRILGLDPVLVFGRLHQQSLGGTPAVAGLRHPSEPDAPHRREERDEPVVVRPADSDPGGYTLPWADDGVPLDPSTVRRILGESSAAAALLTSIFEATPDAAPSPTHDVPGLDQAHGRLLGALAVRPVWTREEFASLAVAHGVLPDGALDVLNEVAIDAVGVPVVDDGATLAVDHDVLRELLA